MVGPADRRRYRQAEDAAQQLADALEHEDLYGGPEAAALWQQHEAGCVIFELPDLITARC